MKKNAILIISIFLLFLSAISHSQTDYPLNSFGVNNLFRNWNNATQDYYGPGLAMSTMADQFTCSWGNAGMRALSSEPRVAFNNSMANTDIVIIRNFWNAMYQIIDTANFLLAETGNSINFGLEGQNNDLVTAFSYFNRGISYGYLALVFDKAIISVNPGADLASLPYASNEEIIQLVINDIETSIVIFDNQLGPVWLPNTWINGQNFTGTEMAKICRSFLARILVLNSRNAAQNAGLDWNYIANLTYNGMNADLNIELDDQNWQDLVKVYSQYYGWLKTDHRIIGLLDENYPNRWPYDNESWDTPDGQAPGEAVSPDARLMTDFTFEPSNAFNPVRGYYHFSNYRYTRYEELLNTWTGSYPIYLGWENMLMYAESQVHLGNLSLATIMLNNPAGARKARGGLADVPPGLSSKELLDIIFYERDIDLMLSGMGISFFDLRRRDALQKGTPLHFPVPASFLEERGELLYTFGGENNADDINVASGSNAWDEGFYFTVEKPSCDYGVNDWSIIMSSPFDDGSFGYSIDNGETFSASNVFTSLPAGDYFLRVKNSLEEISYLKTIQLDTFKVNLNVTNTCFGTSEGSITASVSGGVLPYSYSWSTGSEYFSISGLSAGTYTLVVTDATGCSLTVDATIMENQEVQTPIISGPSMVHYLGEYYFSVPEIENYSYSWNVDGLRIVWMSEDNDSIRLKIDETFDTRTITAWANLNGCWSEDAEFMMEMDSSFVESKTLFNKWMMASLNYDGPAMAMATMADQYTCSWGNAGMRALSSEPRQEFNNTSNYQDQIILSNYWNSLYDIIYKARDIIRNAEEMQASPENNELKNAMLAWGYFNLGLAHGYIALVFDQGWMIDMNTDLSALSYYHYNEIHQYALYCLDMCIDICQNPFSLPDEFISGNSVYSAFISQLANSYAARLMLQQPRNAEMNSQIEWERLRNYAENGLTHDFEVYMDDVNWYDLMTTYLNFQGWAMIDHRIIHLMDPDYPERWPDDNFSWETQDGMDPGEASSFDQRLYTDFQFVANNYFRPDRGYYHFSHYRYKRYDDYLSIWTMPKTIFAKAENDLMLAEYYLNVGNKYATADILNNGTRTSRGQLAYLNGSESMDELREAIFYERDIELISSFMGISFFDMRRRDMHQVGTPLHFPVPARILEPQGLPTYSFGGVEKADGWNTADGKNQWDKDLFVEISKSSCNYANDWSITVVPIKGEPPYQFSLDGGTMQQNASFTNLSSGSHTISILDNLGQQFTDEFVLNNLNAWSVLSTNTCYASENGSISIEIEGGVAPVDINWSNGDMAKNISGLAAGEYTATITDAMGCQTQVSQFVEELSEIIPPVVHGPTQVNPGDSVVFYVEYDPEVESYSFTASFQSVKRIVYLSPRRDSVSIVFLDVPIPESSYIAFRAVKQGCASEFSYLYLNQEPTGPHFQTVWTGNGTDHMNFYALSATLDGENLQPGDEIAVFDGDYCVGVGILTEALETRVNYLSFVASKNDATPPHVNGYTAGHQVSFRIWDASAQVEIDRVTVNYVSGTGIFEVGGMTSFHLSANTQVEQQLSLDAGWNLMSFYVEPDDWTMTSILQPLINETLLVKVQDEAGNAIEYVNPIGWIYNINQMSNTEGYKIKVTDNYSLPLTGYEIEWPFTIPLTTGWNIIGYPSQWYYNTQVALEDIINSGSFLKMQNETGAAIEYVEPIGWIFNIPELVPGEGYKLKVSSNTSLSFESNNKKSSPALVSIPDPAHFLPCWEGNGLDHMNIYLLTKGLENLELTPGDEVGIFDGDLCVGYGVFSSISENYIALIASMDDPTTPSKDGFSIGNPIHLKVWKHATAEIFEVSDIHFDNRYTSRFEKMSTAVAEAEFDRYPGLKNSIGPVYPNPIKEYAEISYSLANPGHVRIELYDLLGRKISDIIDGYKDSGKYRLQWEVKASSEVALSPGVYFLKMWADDEFMTEKIILE